MYKFLLLLYVTLSCGAESVKIITYNVLYGFNHGKNIKEGQAWLKAQQADFIALQEMKGFDANNFAKLAKTWGHEHSYFYKRPHGMPLAFSSRFPISEVEELHKGVKRGFLKLKCRGINFIILHMTSQRLSARKQELNYISPTISKLLKKKEKVIVLGDFNSLSPLDMKRLSELDDLLEEMRNTPRKKPNLNDNNFDVGIMTAFEDLGLVDLCHQHLQGQKDLQGSFPSTLIEKIPNREVQEKHLRRIDFILSDAINAKNLSQAAIPKGGELEKISDHYPIIIELNK